MQSLSIIIVNYKSAVHITNCIESALQFPSAKEFEWIVADNNSGDLSKEILTTKFPFIKWIDMGYNAGFARANNAGIKISKGDIVLLLNPDTIIIDDALKKCLLKFSSANHEACGVQLLNDDGSPQISGNYFMKGGLNHLLPLPYMGNFLRKIAFSFNAKKTNIINATTDVKVDWINGAFLMVKKTAIQKSGLMDEDFFLYAEEAEWCSRIGQHGDLYIYGDLHIKHLQGETINTETNSSEKGYQNIFDKKGLQLLVSNVLRIRKQEGVFWYLVNMFFYTIEIPVFLVGFFIEKIFLKNSKIQYQFDQVRGYSNNVVALWKLSKKIILKKQHLYKII